MLAGLRWLDEDVTWPWAHARIATLSDLASEMLSDLPGVTVLTPPSHAGLISFTVDGQPAGAVVAGRRAWRGYVGCRSAAGCASTGFFNTEDDLNALCDACAVGLRMCRSIGVVPVPHGRRPARVTVCSDAADQRRRCAAGRPAVQSAVVNAGVVRPQTDWKIEPSAADPLTGTSRRTKSLPALSATTAIWSCQQRA